VSLFPTVVLLIPRNSDTTTPQHTKMKINLILFIVGIILFSACSQAPEWTYKRTIKLDDIAPLGMVKNGDFLWVSDSDNNKILKVDMNGKVVETYDDFERPMHIDMDDSKLFIPEYGADTIRIINGQKKSHLPLNVELDAPAAVDIQGEDYLIADFYNHRIVYSSEGKDLTFGEKGKADGEFHYPTDIQFANDLIYVADAYNNRIQVFDKSAKFQQSIGEEDDMNAATGIYVTDREIAVTDFENSRVLVYNLEGKLSQIIEENLNKPTDVVIHSNELYIANYKDNSISVYVRNIQ